MPTPDVTLEEDLRRRDLTINAMAENAAGELIDPYGGRADLEARVFRHVSGVRRRPGAHPARGALRRAFPDFSLAPETWR
jgi:tRNA nucleotidyltransferase (CCA-adding enzyme)